SSARGRPWGRDDLHEWEDRPALCEVAGLDQSRRPAVTQRERGTMRTTSIALLSLVALGMAEGPSRAATVEPKVQLLVRERPSTSARIVDRVPAGRKLPLVGRTADGMWAHVQAPRSDGWVPSEQLRGMVKARKQAVESDEDDQVADDEEEVRKPLAKRRNVRPEAWVSASRYHDGESNKLTIS